MKNSTIQYKKEHRLDRAYRKDRKRRPEFWKEFISSIQVPNLIERIVALKSKEPPRISRVLTINRYED